MKAAGTALVVVTAAACLTALGLSIYPGVLNDLLLVALFFACLAIPIGGISGLVVVIVLARSGVLKGCRMPWSRLALSLLILLGTFLLLAFYVPRRLAFATARPAFMQLVPQARPSAFGGTSLHRRCGVYTVDEYAADPRGGVYFRTHRGQDGIGPDVMSYGFAYKPNRLGTPFGAADYATFPLGDDWYWFRASDDWY